MATVTKGRTFVSGETVTPAKLNELVDSATVTNIVNADVSASAAIVYSKLNLTNSIVAGDIASDAVTTTKILNANVTPAKLSQPYTLETSKASTSGTSIEFTGIPSWAKRITLMLNGVSTNGTSNLLVQIGDSGGLETTGYTSASSRVGGSGATAYSTSTTGFVVGAAAAAEVTSGIVVISTFGSNIWVSSHSCNVASVCTLHGGGTKTLSDVLDRVTVTTAGGTNTFDAGSINIAYEG